MTWGKRRAIVIILVLVFVVVAIFWSAASKPGLRIASNSVLVMDASGQIEEQRAPDFFSAFNGPVPVLHDYVDALDEARTDPRTWWSFAKAANPPFVIWATTASKTRNIISPALARKFGSSLPRRSAFAG
jgi:hypothetical protein